MQRRNVTVTDEQDEWLKKNHIKLSGVVQDSLKEKMGGRQ